MELLAVITVLEQLKSLQKDVYMYSYSGYVVDAINKNWPQNWVKKNFKNVKNVDLRKRFISVVQVHKIQFHWIKGH
jgi:ribonuclease HI